MVGFVFHQKCDEGAGVNNNPILRHPNPPNISDWWRGLMVHSVNRTGSGRGQKQHHWRGAGGPPVPTLCEQTCLWVLWPVAPVYPSARRVFQVCCKRALSCNGI